MSVKALNSSSLLAYQAELQDDMSPSPTPALRDEVRVVTDLCLCLHRGAVRKRRRRVKHYNCVSPGKCNPFPHRTPADICPVARPGYCIPKRQPQPQVGTRDQSKPVKCKGAWAKKPFAASVMQGDQATLPATLGARKK
ncbi:unnamed protein product [Merluccius merluccius]